MFRGEASRPPRGSSERGGERPRMGFDRKRFEPGFRAEADELLRRLEAGLAAVRAGGAGGGLLGEMALAAHTLRGSSTMMGLAPVGAVARQVENFLCRARAGEAAVGAAQIDLLAECLRSIRALMEGGEPADGFAERAARIFDAGAAQPGEEGARCRRRC